MIKVLQRSTERPGLGPSIEEIITDIIKDKENLEQVSSEPSGTSSGPLPFNLVPKISSAYHYYFLQAVVSRAHDKQFRKVIANYKELLDSISRMSQEEIWGGTLSPYPTLDLGLEALEQLYILRRRSEVIKFLEDNSFLFPTLKEAYRQIRNNFGKSVQLILEVITDPEVAGEQEVVIFVHINISPDEAFKKLEQLDEEWWLDAPANARGKVCIDVEFE